MTKAKKAIGVILAVVMLATMFAFGSFAAAAGNATFTVTPSATQVEVGDTVTVTVAVTTDYYAGPIGVPVHYDAALFDYVENSFTPNADIYGAGAADANAFNNNGCLTVAFAPKSEVAGVKAQVLNNVTLFTFQLTAKANGVSPVQLKAEDQKALGNMTGKLYCGQKANATITSEDIMIGQTFTLNNSSVTIGSAAAPELQLSETGAANGVIIDRVSMCNDGNGFIYGIDTDQGASIEEALATPSGSIRVTENEQGALSTGATIELLDDAGNVVETYFFIFFGDVNGDGWVDASDVTSVEGTASYSDFDYAADDGSVAGMAADINGDGWIDATDVSYVEGVASYSDFPTQAEAAANVAAAKGIA